MPNDTHRHSRTDSWYHTSGGEIRGSIRPHSLDEVWFHTGTTCNLSCSFCLEGSKPGDERLQRMRFEDVRPFIDEALFLGVKQFSFTGGEPFVVRDLVRILDYALTYRPCLVLTNATDPLIRRLPQIQLLKKKASSLHFRVSLDHFDPEIHDAGRGEGMFQKALDSLCRLVDLGFPVSVACRQSGATSLELSTGFSDLFRKAGLPEELVRIEFPELHPPGALISVPEITEHCLTTYQTEDSRRSFMCAFSKMVVKIGGRMRVYACTLVDDDPDYDMGGSLVESLEESVGLKHHRCYSCFSSGSSCSELPKQDAQTEKQLT